MKLAQMVCILDKKKVGDQETAYWRMTTISKLRGKYREAQVFAFCWQQAADMGMPPARVKDLRHFVHSFDVETKADVLFEVVDTLDTLAKYDAEKAKREAAARAAAEAIRAHPVAIAATPSNTVTS